MLKGLPETHDLEVILHRSTLRAAVAGLAVGSSLLALTGTAHAATATSYQLNVVGSDTTFCSDNAVAAAYNTANVKKSKNAIDETPALLSGTSTPVSAGCETAPITYSIPADSVHGAITYTTNAPANLPPNGASAGISAFVADNGLGNIAAVRSTRGRLGTDPSTLDFWAYALDAVTWDHFTGGLAPANLTTAQINQIYTCQVTDWSQVGGQAGTIQRFFPQVGSGIGKQFATLFLGGTYPSATGSCPVTYVQQNDATQIPSASQSAAIVPYAFSAYTAQTNAATTGYTNLAAGTSLGSVNKVAPSLKAIKESAAFANITGDACTSAPVTGQYCASIYDYHVTSQVLGTNEPAYQAAIVAEFGVPASGTAVAGGFCSGKDAKVLKVYGLTPLTKATTAQSSSSDPVAGASDCRQF